MSKDSVNTARYLVYSRLINARFVSYNDRALPPHVYPHVYLMSCMWLSQAFPLCFCILQAIKNLRREQPGNEATWHVNGWHIGFGWKVHGMVDGNRCMAFFNSPVGNTKFFCLKMKTLLLPGCRTWTLEYLETQRVTHTVLPPNIAAVSLVTTHSIVKWEPRQTWHSS